MSDNPHVQYANAKLRHKKQKSQGFHSDAKHAEREMIRISNLHKIKTGKHINDHAEKLVAHHEKAKEIKRQYVQHSTDLIHAKKAGDKERMEYTKPVVLLAKNAQTSRKSKNQLAT